MAMTAAARSRGVGVVCRVSSDAVRGFVSYELMWTVFELSNIATEAVMEMEA
jgi:hypothetical protein